MKLVILTLALLLIAVLLLGVRVFFVRGGKFPSTHVEANDALRSRGIGCAKHLR